MEIKPGAGQSQNAASFRSWRDGSTILSCKQQFKGRAHGVWEFKPLPCLAIISQLAAIMNRSFQFSDCARASLLFLSLASASLPSFGQNGPASTGRAKNTATTAH